MLLNFLELLTLLNFYINFSNGKQLLISGHPFKDSEDNTPAVHGQEKRSEERISITFPGTRWCGPGNTAEGFDDIGKYEDTDKCCRSHDHCENIPSGEEKFGLRNDDWFTRLHCDCDRDFYHCLHSVNRTVSTVIGRQYFFFRDRCFKKAFPIVECMQYQQRIFVRRCIEYRFDSTETKIYQWFDLPLYDVDKYPELDNEKQFYEEEHSNNIQQQTDMDFTVIDMF